MRGCRLIDEHALTLFARGTPHPCAYGRVTLNDRLEWWVCCPDGQWTQLWVNEDDPNGNRHIVTEHDPGGAITVDGSIQSPDNGYHGHLVRGEWVEC